MMCNPVSLSRPVLVLNGYRSPWLTSSRVVRLLCSVTSGRAQDFLPISYPLAGSIEAAAERTYRKASHRWPDGTVFDVVAISMGGLVARLLASGMAPCGTIGIARLFTLATPHKGAVLARWIVVDRAARSMKEGSDFLARLDSAITRAPLELVCYAQLRDWWVGARNCSPPGIDTFWTAPRTLMGRLHSHVQITHNRLVLADIARRLRGEPPIGLARGMPPRD